MPVDLSMLADDLAVETTWVEALVAPLDDDGWTVATPAPGWSVHDQMTHLAYFDGATTTALVDPDRFVAERDGLRRDSDDLTGVIAARHQDVPHAEVLEWFGEVRREMLGAFSLVDAAHRVPWYGPTMSAGAALTARIMETWAHGQDIADAVGVAHPSSPALRQVSHIGVRALPNSFRTRGLDVPDTAVFVSLRGPDGDEWVWGDPSLPDRVVGDARDFCLVVTQRRHLTDTALEVVGPVATTWMPIAQAFAGTAGAGRAPGQFSRS